MVLNYFASEMRQNGAFMICVYTSVLESLWIDFGAAKYRKSMGTRNDTEGVVRDEQDILGIIIYYSGIIIYIYNFRGYHII